jgi:hypothetical protein
LSHVISAKYTILGGAGGVRVMRVMLAGDAFQNYACLGQCLFSVRVMRVMRVILSAPTARHHGTPLPVMPL